MAESYLQSIPAVIEKNLSSQRFDALVNLRKSERGKQGEYKLLNTASCQSNGFSQLCLALLITIIYDDDDDEE